MIFRKANTVFILSIFLMLCVNCFSQPGNNYDAQWKKVDDFVNKGLTKSALDEVNKIYETAKKEKNDPQLIKSLLYQVTLNQNTQENATEKNIANFERETALAKEPAKSILYSITAEMYWNFFQQQRYKLYNRTKTDNSFKKDDIQTWGVDDFHKKIGELYLLSIKEEKLLQQTRLEPFDAIIIRGNVRHLRPTLYDLLAHRALDYFKSSETDITRPAYAFEIKDEKVFADAKEFSNHKFQNKDSASLHYKALLIFQELLSFHANDTRPGALIDADIERINFASQYGVMNNKDELYMRSLQQLVNNHPNDSSAAQASYLIAQTIFGKATSDTLHYSFKKAKEIAEEVANRFPSSEGGINAKNLLGQILHKELNLTSEKVDVPGEAFRTLVSYRNFSSINLRIIELTPAFKKLIETNEDNDALWKKLISQKSYRSWKQQLPATGDYRNHSVEIKVDGLPVGQYALLASVSEDFSLNKNPLAVQYFHVSNISFINNVLEYFILDRTTGKPLANANVQVWLQHYDYNARKNILEKKQFLTADENGYLKIPESKKNEDRNIRLEITHENDKLFLDDYQYSYYYNDEEEKYENQKEYDEDKAKIFLFTDRSIYRPGQLVYFKGIGVTQNYKTKKNQLLENKEPVTIYLTDANSQKVDSLKLVLNEYGSFNGKFRLPQNRLNGEFTIEVSDYENSSIDFSVEEYKRPKFYTEFEKVKGTYRVNDKIKITGFAKAYAGNNVDGANVKYRVTRTARFLYDWMWWYRPRPSSSSLEITNGEIKTDANGKFTIEFEAIPDLSVDKNTDPVFDYKVEADVTDINGETRSTSTTVPVGYKAMNLQVTLPSSDPIPSDSLKHFFVSTTNLSGEFEPSKADVKIYKLQPPQRLIRSRFWTKPDKFLMSKEEYIKYFPHDEYKDELQKQTWPKGEMIYSVTDSTTSNSKFIIHNPKFSQGWYVIEATSKDKYGQELKDVKYFQLYDMKTSSLPAPGYSWSTIIKNIVEPGEEAKFIAGSSAKDLFIIQEMDVNKNGKQSKNSYDFLNLSNEKKNFEFEADEKDRGGFGVYQFFVKDNRFYTTSWNVAVPWSNKQLAVSFDTYRDKTQPGSEEKWKIKISGSKSEKVAAEVLVSMYDASLDQFKPHSWNSFYDIWPVYYGNIRWNGVQNFATVGSSEKWWQEDYAQAKPKNYDELIYGNYSYRNGGYYRTLSGRVSGIAVQREMSQAPMDKNASLQEVVVTAQGIQRQTKELTYSTSSIILRGNSTITENPGALIVVDGVPFKGNIEDLNPDQLAGISVLKGDEATALYGSAASKGAIIITTKSGAKQKEDLNNVKTRKNFDETAFFFPELRIDKNGNVEFSFTMPEALTQWKLMTFAHTKDLASGYGDRTVITQKELMVQPFAPRFLREGDKMEFSAKIVNMSDKPITGQAQLQLLNAATNTPVDVVFKNISSQKSFSIPAGQSTAVKFSIDIPYNYNNAVVYRIVAKASPLGGGLEGVSDGEEAAIPVLTNRMLVTETMPLPVRGTATKNFTFEKLLNSGKSSTLTNFSLTTEFTTNPAWYAVQALPYLMEFPYECAEQTFNRYYANSIASKIVNSSPKIKTVFEKWKITDTAALMSNLQKNEDLKSVLLQETPWVLQAQNESQQKKNIALLFDVIRMSNELESTLAKLSDMQSSNGGFVWFKGGPDDRYMTQYIVTGIGHLKKLGALSKSHEEKIRSILNTAIPYLDHRIKEDYDNLIKYKVKLDQNNLGYIDIQYLYMRSFFPEYAIAKESETAYNYYRGQTQKYWLSQSKYMQGMIALSLYRTNDKATPQAITRSLKENSINNEELGMYWKEFETNRSWWWYQAPIESQAMMIETFSEIEKDPKTVDDLKTWLLKNKQTNNWHTTKATAEACYAMLLQGTDWLSEEKNVTIQLGNLLLTSSKGGGIEPEAGTGYFKTKIEGDKVKPEMGNISVKVSGSSEQNNGSTSWGAVYWQYFENLDKITFAETPLKLSKKLFVEKNTDRGPVLTPINEGDQVKVGDKIKVRIELRVDRDMEYVHMKDMRAACMEPTNVISQYKYQGGLGYYESTKDASTNFFFGYLNKGTYVFEYPMFVTHSGNFSNGITTIQCMYAPEFTAHSEGVRVTVSE